MEVLAKLITGFSIIITAEYIDKILLSKGVNWTCYVWLVTGILVTKL